MELVLSPEAWLSAGLIFALRVTDMSLDTLRVLFVMRGRKALAWVLGFLAVPFPSGLGVREAVLIML